ncbi:MAG: hypothetical protein K6G69_09485 [Lachnospiraceae bacterium]|nr:hypothetical protein [Lachnospiraceae bacterium]
MTNIHQMEGTPIYFIVIVAVGFLAIILWGYLWNYYLIKELKQLNSKMQSIEDALRRIARNNTGTTPTSPTTKAAKEEQSDWQP